MKKKLLYDDRLGVLVVQEHARAKNLAFRAKDDAIYVTVPVGCSEKVIMDALDQLRDRLTIKQQEIKSELIDLNYRLTSDFIELTLVPVSLPVRQFSFQLNGKIAKLICPEQTDFTDVKVQDFLKRALEQALKRVACGVLPQRLHELAIQYQFHYSSVTIRSSRTRWGSCSSKKSISLSLYLMLLPQRLVDYVLLHELCHTCEMNHGPEFWNLLNKVTQNKALQYREELKNFKTRF